MKRLKHSGPFAARTRCTMHVSTIQTCLEHLSDGDAQRLLLSDELGQRPEKLLRCTIQPCVFDALTGHRVVEDDDRTRAAEWQRQNNVLPDALVRVVTVDESDVQLFVDVCCQKAASGLGVTVTEELLEVLNLREMFLLSDCTRV